MKATESTPKTDGFQTRQKEEIGGIEGNRRKDEYFIVFLKFRLLLVRELFSVEGLHESRISRWENLDI